MNHKQKEISLGEYTFSVDEKIVDLILLLNECGYHTELSCEDNNGKIWIMFPSSFATQLMTELCKFSHETGDNDLFEYLSCTATWTVVYEEDSINISDDEVEGIGELSVYHSLRFPKEDLNMIEKLLKIFTESRFYEKLQ